MNLIEQFGYEAVKSELKNKKWRKDNLHGSAEFTWHMEQHIQLLEAALLQHRRQHNIFEVGDKVVSRCADKEIRIFTYQETIGRNILVKCKKGKGYCYPKKWFSHANDAEIKAGKRLEVNQ